MRKVNNKYIFILGLILGLIISGTTVYAVEAYIESSKVTYNNHNKKNVQDAIDELYEKSGIHKNKWIDPILNGADPVLKSPLIPVEIKNNGDVYYANENSEWYNYGEKRWANAVILIDNPSNSNYKVGDHILESDIESYFVWIPRYQYKVWDLGQYTSVIDTSTMINNNYNTSASKLMNNSRIIDVKFGTVDLLPKMIENEAKIDSYYTHPAFTFGENNLKGFWIGKFETGYKDAEDVTSAQADKVETNSIIIKPNVYAWNKIKLKNMFINSYEYERELESHMLKNTEWGAVAYLSHSAYGKGGEININNNLEYKTGYSSYNEVQNAFIGETQSTNDITKIKPWNTIVGYLASTTGNITGVYDMSGGTWEYVAAYMDQQVGSSGFELSELNTKYKYYFDVYYPTNSDISFNNRILGDATGEMGPFYKYYEINDISFNHNSWYSDSSVFINSQKPFFRRGGGSYGGSLSGIFYFDPDIGIAWRNIGFRIALYIN